MKILLLSLISNAEKPITAYSESKYKFDITYQHISHFQDSRGITFTDEVGYVAIDKGFQCLQKCGQKQNWAGFCDDCGLSNGSPGFCCHPDGRGHCSPGMIKIVANDPKNKFYETTKILGDYKKNNYFCQNICYENFLHQKPKNRMLYY